MQYPSANFGDFDNRTSNFSLILRINQVLTTYISTGKATNFFAILALLSCIFFKKSMRTVYNSLHRVFSLVTEERI